jgi:signal transduction histidine kinase
MTPDLKQETMAARIAAFDWSSTALGPADTWPEPLRAAVQLMLNSRFPMFVWWGHELINLYNDAYVPVLGSRHPSALGRPAAEIWYEIWDVVGAQADLVIQRQQATWNEEVLLVMERHGYTEETYFTWSYSPILNSDGIAAGLFCACTEDTAKVIGRRRLATLRDVSAGTTDLKNEREVLATATSVMSRNPYDLPFTLLYVLDRDGKRAWLAGAAGVRAADKGAPAETGAAPHENPWGLDLLSSETRVLSSLDCCFAEVPSGPWPLPPAEALCIPLRSRGEDQPAGVLITGINRYTLLDDEYRAFLTMLSGHIETAIANSRAYEAERRRAESLAELDRAKTLFFSNVSHEFRTPLTLMLGPLEDLLSAPGLDPSERSQLELIRRNGLRLLKLVNTLLDFSRIEAGRVQAIFEPVDLAALTADIASSFRSAMERAGVTFTVDCEPLSRPAWVDREMWEKIVLNLLSNAFKYTLRGSVRLELKQSGDAAELSVTDTGIGISEQDLPHVFERFHRAAGVPGRTDEGTGIGLALVQELAKLHNGVVSVTSEQGRGSRFIVAVPLHERRGPAPVQATRSTAIRPDAFIEEALRWVPGPPSPSADQQVAGTRPHVLIADDNTDMREYLVRLLSQHYRVTAVSNGEEALAAAIDNHPDLVLTDVMMPVLDGFGLLAALKAHPDLRLTPVIFLSARSGEESVVAGLDGGADDYLMKPFTARELIARVSAHLALRQERQRTHERLVQVFRQAPVGIVVLRGPEHVIELANPTYQALFAGRDLVGRRFSEVVPELNEDLLNGFRYVLSTGKPFRASQLYVPYDFDRDGMVEDHWFNVNYEPIQEADGTVSGLVTVLTEVTAEVLARNELERANKELEEFAYVASHDLQEPLRMVNIYAQLLLRRPGLQSDKEAAQFSKFIQTGVSRMEQLIQALLAYSRVVLQEEEPARTADLNRSLGEAIAVLRMRIDESQAIITHDPLPVSWGDEQQFALVFQNLLSNSIKYCPDGKQPKIHISVEAADGHCLIRLTDNGIGFAARHADRIFGLFKRLHKDKYPGTGLGLAICRRIVERYSGRIWAESEGEGSGATFSILLPKVQRTDVSRPTDTQDPS